MALTEAQMTDTRRYMGYQVVGTTMPINGDSDVVYGAFGMVTMSLYTRLTTLTPAEEAVLISKYLTNLNDLENDLFSVRDNLDTDKAAVWTHNKLEIADRFALYNRVRRALCGFIGFAPGPDLCSAGASTRLVRS
jgi:hypothetical protein